MQTIINSLQLRVQKNIPASRPCTKVAINNNWKSQKVTKFSTARRRRRCSSTMTSSDGRQYRRSRLEYYIDKIKIKQEKIYEPYGRNYLRIQWQLPTTIEFGAQCKVDNTQDVQLVTSESFKSGPAYTFGFHYSSFSPRLQIHVCKDAELLPYVCRPSQLLPCWASRIITNPRLHRRGTESWLH